MKQTDRTNNHGLFRLLLFALVMLLPIGAWGQTVTVANNMPENDGTISGPGITGTVTFEGETLTLKDATITGNITWDGSYNSLNVKLIGHNTITGGFEWLVSGGYGTPPSVYFQRGDNTQDCSLRIINDATPFTGFTGPTVSGLSWYEGTGEYIVATDYKLSIGNLAVTSYNAGAIQEADEEYINVGEGGYVTFDDTNAILTLNNATLHHGIISELGDLTIRFEGTNIVNIDSQEDFNYSLQSAAQENAIKSNNAGTLTFECINGGTVDLYGKTTANYPVINGFDAIDYSKEDTKCYLHTVIPAIYDGRTMLNFLLYNATSITNATISSDMAYPLWIGSGTTFTQVTDENKNNITSNSITGSVKYTPSTQTLSLTNASIEGKIMSAVGDLTLEFSGENEVAAVDTGVVVRSANGGTFTIQKKTGEINVLLTLRNSPSDYDPHRPVIQSFGDIVYDGLDIATSTSSIEYGSFYMGDDYCDGLFDSEAQQSQNWNISAITQAQFTDTPISYGITITDPDGNDYLITNKNRINVLNEQTEPSVQFDGFHTLILNDANLSSIDIAAQHDNLPELTIYLTGNNTVDNGEEGIGYGGDPFDLTFATDNFQPGTLNLSYDDPGGGKTPSSLFDNITITYANNLSASLNIQTHIATIAQSMPPIVNVNDRDEVLDGDGDGLGKDIEYDGYSDEQKTVILTAGVIVNKILYRLPDADDGNWLEDGNNVVCLNSYMTDTEMEGIATQVENGTLFPGTEGFAEVFKGMCFLVPEGSGDIIIECNTGSLGELHVYKGTDDIKEITVTEGFETIIIPYAFTKDTYLYLYSAVPKAVSSRFNSSLRAPGKKLTTTTQIRRAGVKAGSVGSTPPPPLSPKKLTKADVDAALATVDDPGLIGLRITDAEYVGIADDAFDNLNDKQTAFIDLSQTSIIDQIVDRTKAPFNKLPNGAFVYLPVGNDLSTASTAKIENVVIGTVCPDMQLSESRPFKAGIDFTAEKAKLDRIFVKDQRSSIFLPFAIDKETVSGLGAFYEFTGITDGKVIMTPLAEDKGTEANIPYMFKAAKESLSFEMVDVKSVLAELPHFDGVAFEGTYEQIDILSTSDFQYYCFMNDDGKFVHVVDQPVTVKPFRAYLVKAGSVSLSNVFDIDWGDDTTGLNDVRSKMYDVRGDVFFDLQGRQVAKPTKGIYIQNGKKVVIK